MNSATLKDTPIRPDADKVFALLGDHVVVTDEWYEANEAQLRHLTECALQSDRMVADLTARLEEATAARDQSQDEIARLVKEMNTPETLDFISGVMREAAHQRNRWPSDHDAGKETEDWFWLVGALAGKACRYFALERVFAEEAAVPTFTVSDESARLTFESKAKVAHAKGIHHVITTAAALANWHLNVTGADERMRPGRPVLAAFQTEEEPEPLHL